MSGTRHDFIPLYSCFVPLGRYCGTIGKGGSVAACVTIRDGRSYAVNCNKP